MTRAHLGFDVQTVYRVKRPRVIHYAKQRLSFVIAAAAVFSFVIGNMVGQHGWYAFWKSVLGKEEIVVFNGAVTPIEALPSDQWALTYGGDTKLHTYSEVPRDLLVPLPTYVSADMRHRDTIDSFETKIYCTANLGDYVTGNEHAGSHVGIDICGVPHGTPVRAVAAGVVEKTVKEEVGFGHYVMIKHWVPDPNDPQKLTIIHSTYAHLDEITVEAGQVVEKGWKIGTVGRTGFASDYHLHFQIETDDAPFHPLWIFTSQESTQAGLSFVGAINAGLHQERGDLYTLNPMLFVQQYEGYVPPATIAGDQRAGTMLALNDVRTLPPVERMRALRAERRRIRLARLPVALALRAADTLSSSAASASAPGALAVTSAVKTAEADTPLTAIIAGASNTDVDHIIVEHDGSFSRGWETVRISTRNKYGDTVKSPVFPGRISLTTGFGTADFEPSALSASSFAPRGEVTVRMLPHGQRTIVIQTKGAFEMLSNPMVYQK